MSQHLNLIAVFLLLSGIPPTLGATNTTAEIHFGDSNHKDPNLLCKPTKWTDIVVFFLGNYIAHAATIMTLPGESSFSVAIATVEALLFPVTGMLRGVRIIRRLPILGRNQLEIAARAGALYMVVKEANGEQTDETITFDTETHGRYHLPEGYSLRPVPWNAKFKDKGRNSPWNGLFNTFRKMRRDDRSEETDKSDIELAQNAITICCNYNIVKILVALGQTVFAAATLYRTRGDQIDRYGYAAFGLTVTPYVYMSFINLLANLACPTYPTRYLVRSKDMQGLEELVDGVVGEIEECSQSISTGDAVLMEPSTVPLEKPGTGRIRKVLNILRQIVIAWACAAPPIAIVGGLSFFQNGQSTRTQRVWTMTWLAFGLSLAGVADYISRFIRSLRSKQITRRLTINLNQVAEFKGIRQRCTSLDQGYETVLKDISFALDSRDWPWVIRNEMSKVERAAQEIDDTLGTASKHSLEANSFLIVGLAERISILEAGLESLRELKLLEEAEANNDKRLEADLRLIHMPPRDNPATPEEREKLHASTVRTSKTLHEVRQKCDELFGDLKDMEREDLKRKNRVSNVSWRVGLLIYACFGAPAIGGMVVVGQMLVEYGTCIRID